MNVAQVSEQIVAIVNESGKRLSYPERVRAITHALAAINEAERVKGHEREA